jgi:putative redox protein
LRFVARSGSQSFTLDSGSAAGPSPVQALAAGLAGCMAIDVVHILTKGRLPFRSVKAHLEGERAAEDPKRLLAVRLHFAIEGDIPEEKVARAIALSREKYCSVWHSLRQDIDFQTSFGVEP